jgi:uncharacterized protein (TIGR02147 family)
VGIISVCSHYQWEHFVHICIDDLSSAVASTGPQQTEEIALDSTDWLRQELTKRRSKNPAFSLRSFARVLSVQPGRLSEILARKRPLTSQQLVRFADKLGVEHRQVAKFLKASSSRATQRRSPPSAYVDVSEMHFDVVSEPVHFHILSALELARCDGTVKCLARILGRDVGIIRSSLERLASIGLVNLGEKDRWELPLQGKSTSASYGAPSAALRKAHKVSIQRALNCIDDIPSELRDISSITLAIDASKISVAREMIQKFRRELASVLEVGNKTEVYDLNVQLIPITEVRD